MIFNILKNKRGFSLTELMVAASIFTLLTFGSLSILEYMKKQEEKITRTVSQSTDEEFLNKFMYQLIASGNLGIS
ncbi:MAG: PulJ/GspJ family protein, partial [Bdellovibrionales bacterium]